VGVGLGGLVRQQERKVGMHWYQIEPSLEFGCRVLNLGVESVMISPDSLDEGVIVGE
jgi:hypothetical protein